MFKQQAAYYFLYGVKGLSLYFIMFCIMNFSSGINFSEFGVSYSLFLVLIPFLNMGAASLILRSSYSYKSQQRVFFFGLIIQITGILTAFLLFAFNAEIALVIMWAVFRSAYLSYEAYLISVRNYKMLGSFYAYFILGTVLISVSIVTGFIVNLKHTLISLVVMEFIAIPLVIMHISKQSVLEMVASDAVRAKIFSYVFPIAFISGLMAIFLNLDKIMIDWFGMLRDLEIYTYTSFMVLAIHRFLTTPFIMRYSPKYYESSCNRIPDKLVIFGMLVLLLGCSFAGAAVWIMQPDNYVFRYHFAFGYMVVTLYLLQLYLLYFTKTRQLIKLSQSLLFGLGCSLVVLIITLNIYATEYIDLVVMFNGLCVVYFVKYSVPETVSRLYFKILAAIFVVYAICVF